MRFICRLDLHNEKVVKPLYYDGLRYVGDPVKLSQKADSYFYDEIHLNSCVSTLYASDPEFRALSAVRNSTHIPIIFGGGLNTRAHIRKAFQTGADRVSLCSSVYNDPDLSRWAIDMYGSQAIIHTIVLNASDDDHPTCMTHSAREAIPIRFEEYLAFVDKIGFGEMVIVDSSRDGSLTTLNMDLLKLIPSHINCPFILAGGFSDVQDLSLISSVPNLSGLLISSAFHTAPQAYMPPSGLSERR